MPLYIQTQKGFTLIELLVIVAVVGVLAGAIIAMINPDRQFANARNAQRKKDLRDIANALEAYVTVNGSYPVSGASVWCNTSATGAYGCGGNNRLGGLLTGGHLKKIPTDPKNNLPNLFNPSCASNNTYGYLYRSDTGTEYKILAYCTPEVNIVTSTDPMKDPARTTTSWSIYSPGASGY